MVKTTNSIFDRNCDTCICNDCKMNETKGVYGGCFDCEDCEDGDMHCESCTMFEKELNPQFIGKIICRLLRPMVLAGYEPVTTISFE